MLKPGLVHPPVLIEDEAALEPPVILEQQQPLQDRLESQQGRPMINIEINPLRINIRG